LLFYGDQLCADVAHLVERHLAKVEVASSSLVIRSIGVFPHQNSRVNTRIADVAHLVERHLAKVEVASSSLVIRSSFLESVGNHAGAFLLDYKNPENG
jgi:hypothetical protein